MKEISDWARCLEKAAGNGKQNWDDEGEQWKILERDKPGPIYVRYYSKEHVAVEKEMSSHQDVTLDELNGILFQI